MHFGLYTTDIYGKIILKEQVWEKEIFIVAFQKRVISVNVKDDKTYRTTIKIIPLSSARYKVSFESNIQSQTLYFIAPYHHFQAKEFFQSLFVGRIHHDATLIQDTTWRENYFLRIRPFLNDVVQSEANISGANTLFVSQWMENREQEFNK